MTRLLSGDVVLAATDVAHSPAEPLAPGVAGIANAILTEHAESVTNARRAPGR